MKKVICIAAVVMLFVAQASAQQTHFGLKAGLNIATVDVTNNLDYSSIAGLHIGGLAHIHVSPHFALQPELTYSMQGTKYDATTLRLHYVNIPLLGQYMINDGFRLETGPQLGILASAKTKNGNVEIDQKENFSSIDFSWAFGAGYLIPNSGGWGIDARYNLGISDVSDVNAYKAHNRVFQLGVFYQFMHERTAAHRH